MAGCGGGSAPATDATPRATISTSPTTAPQTSFPVEGCPIEDADACAAIGAAATALVEGDADALMSLHRPDVFRCDELPIELFPACDGGGDLRGHPIASAVPVFEVLRPRAYRAQLQSILDGVDPHFADDHGAGAFSVLGVGTCGPEDLARRSYHLGFTAGASAGEGSAAERILGSFEFIHRQGRWWAGLWYLDTLEEWEAVSPDPFASIACGNMESWGTA